MKKLIFILFIVSLGMISFGLFGSSTHSEKLIGFGIVFFYFSVFPFFHFFVCFFYFSIFLFFRFFVWFFYFSIFPFFLFFLRFFYFSIFPFFRFFLCFFYFSVFPIFSYYRWKDKKIEDYYLNNENLRKFKENNDL